MKRYTVRYGFQWVDGFKTLEDAHTWAKANCPGFYSIFSYTLGGILETSELV